MLRIISMYMVIILHLIYGGGILYNEPLSVDWFWTNSLYALCIIAVNCFTLISGYVNVDRRIKIKNILNIGLQATFYSFLSPFFLCYAEDKNVMDVSLHTLFSYNI